MTYSHPLSLGRRPTPVDANMDQMIEPDGDIHHDPDDRDIMLSQPLLQELNGWTMPILQDLFMVHGRRPFLPDVDDLAPGLRSARGVRQKFALAISQLHVAGHLKWLPGGRYKIVSDGILTGAEYKARGYNNAGEEDQ